MLWRVAQYFWKSQKDPKTSTRPWAWKRAGEIRPWSLPILESNAESVKFDARSCLVVTLAFYSRAISPALWHFIKRLLSKKTKGFRSDISLFLWIFSTCPSLSLPRGLLFLGSPWNHGDSQHHLKKLWRPDFRGWADSSRLPAVTLAFQTVTTAAIMALTGLTILTEQKLRVYFVHRGSHCAPQWPRFCGSLTLVSRVLKLLACLIMLNWSFCSI